MCTSLLSPSKQLKAKSVHLFYLFKRGGEVSKYNYIECVKMRVYLVWSRKGLDSQLWRQEVIVQLRECLYYFSFGRKEHKKSFISPF